jgi:inhibitor of KinA
MKEIPAYTIYRLGDSALTIDFGNIINADLNKKVISIYRHLIQQLPPGITDLVPAYSSLTVFYDPVTLKKTTPGDQTVFDRVKNELLPFLNEEKEFFVPESRAIRVPVCYETEFAQDMAMAEDFLKIPAAEIIRLHSSAVYRVYMLGFLPGFAYMGSVEEKIRLPRKSKPVPVAAGSVGIADRQTGVYPLHSPGGWQIIGRSPLSFFSKEKEDPVLFHTGDQVQFYSISNDEFENIKSRNSG